jgi:hypothetical protein
MVRGRRQAAASRQRRVSIRAPSGVSRAEKGRPRMARFPDLRIVAALSASSQADGEPSDGPWTGEQRSRDESEASLAAYSGGTVWAFHPLRVAAGASVELWLRLYQIASDARFSYDTMIMSGGRSPLECSWTSFWSRLFLEPTEADVAVRMKQGYTRESVPCDPDDRGVIVVIQE